MGSSDLLKVTCYLVGLWSLTVALPTKGTYRLPLEVIPLSYSIYLVPYLDEGNSTRQFTFDGNVSILVQAERPETSITLHASGMKILGLPTVSEINSRTIINVTRVTTEALREYLFLHLATPLIEKNFYHLNLSYTGNLQTEMLGFYKNSYRENGTVRWLATTQFERQGARRAFPCFDEPALKATFNISIARPPHMITVSNMPLETTVGPEVSAVVHLAVNLENGKRVILQMKQYEESQINHTSLNGRFWDIYEPSVIMPTYLVAFMMSDFKYLESGIYRVWSKPSTVEEGQYALSICPQVVSTMEDFTGIPYNYPKMDHVAIPRYPGAMENWGMIIYGEHLLLTDVPDASWSIALIVAHEVAHSWFGNLVTFSWWKYTWLTEGFASLFQYLVIDKMFPHSGVIGELTEKGLTEAMHEDTYATSHPLTTDVETPNEIDKIFSDISYLKGASVLKMLAHTITFETFFKGLNVYLTAKSYGNVIDDDLYDSLQKVVDEDRVLTEELTVKAIMGTWTFQTGFPMITVTRNYNTGTATVHQAEFFSNSNEKPSNKSWFIPLTYTTGEDPEFSITKPSLWLTPHKNITIQNLPRQDHWIIFNIQAMGHFRINYDLLNWKLLNDQLHKDPSKIHPLNRMQLLEDSRNLVRAGFLDYMISMDLTTYLTNETDEYPWFSAFRGLQELYSQIGGSKFFPVLQSYYLKVMDRLYRSVGFEFREADSYTVSRLRSELLHWACLLGHEDCIKSSVQNVLRMRSSSTQRPNKHLRGTMYCASVRQGGESSWELMWNVYKNADDVQERKRALSALGCTSDVRLLKRFLTLSVTEDSGLLPEDRMNVFSAACNGRDSVSCDTTLKFISSHFHQLGNEFGEYQTISSILVRVASRIKTKEQVDMLRFIMTRNRKYLSMDEHMLSNAMKMAQENVDWFEKKGAHVVSWLARH